MLVPLKLRIYTMILFFFMLLIFISWIFHMKLMSFNKMKRK